MTLNTLTIELTEGAIKNGYLRIPSGQTLFPDKYWADESGISTAQFTLVLPNGEKRQTCVLHKYTRIQARFNALFKVFSLKPGDLATLTADNLSDDIYYLTFNGAETNTLTSPLAITLPITDIHIIGNSNPLNTILFGPPGTGKTYATIDETLRILDPEFLEKNKDDRAVLKARFDELAATEEIRFVTFHQSFSYEDFVEGLRAENDEDGQLRYEVVDGVFKSLCDVAAVKITRQSEAPIDLTGRKIWKMSLGNAKGWDSYIYDQCIENGYVLLGYGGAIDFSGCTNRQQILDMYNPHGTDSVKVGDYPVTAVDIFLLKVRIGDIFIVTDGNSKFRAIGEITGDYEYLNPGDEEDCYTQCRKVKWLRVYTPSLPLDQLMKKSFMQKTLYELRSGSIDTSKLSALLAPAIDPDSDIGKPRVLIIDEINRGNISRIFGELITLIEPSKRAGAEEALTVTLPYSKKHFSVPSNVYLIGTMNTADRSLSGLDIALRRRFTFKEMPPRPDLLENVLIEAQLDIGKLLLKMNERIEVLLDRDHCLGHAYFMPLKDNPTLENLAFIFSQQILPLLQEYFFEDWERISWVLNDHRKFDDFQFISKQSINTEHLFGGEVNIGNQKTVYRLNNKAFDHIQSYVGILDHQKVQNGNHEKMPS